MARAYEESQREESGGLADTARDVGIDLAQGALRLPGAAAGLADIGPAGALGQRPFRRITSAVGDATGFQPGQWAEGLDRLQSDALTQSQQNVEQAFEGTEDAIGEGRYGDALAGAGRGALALATNPRALASTVIESVPSMLAGGLMGRAVQGLAGSAASAPTLQGALQRITQEGAERVGQSVATGQAARQAAQAASTIQRTPRLGGVPAAGIGEGAVMAGMSMDSMDDDVDPQRAAAAAAVTGIGGGLLGVGGGRLAERLGVVNPEQVVMGRAGRAGTELGRGRNLPARIAGGFVSEGLFEEMPQETLETVAGNWAEGEPLFANVPRAAIEGLMAGGAMGGVMNIRRPRSVNDVTDLTGRVPPEPEETSPEGPRTLNPQDAEVSDMLRYHRRLARVATEATQHPDLQQQALERIDGVLNELDRRGVPREVVNQELAKKRYQDIEDQSITMAQKYRSAVQTNPQAARTYLEKLQGLTQQKQAIEQRYDRQTLLGPDFETAQRLKGDEQYADLFRSVKGERTNQLKPSAQKKLTEFREMGDDDLLRAVARDLEDGEVGAEVNRWAPLREAAARDRGFSEEQIREVQAREYGQRAEQAVSEADVDAAFDDTGGEITDEQAESAAEQFVAGSDSELAVAQRDAENVSRETSREVAPARDPRWQQLEQVSNQSPAARDAIGAIGEALAESDAGYTASTILQRASELFAERRPNVQNPRQSMDSALRKLTPRLRAVTGDPNIPNLSPQRIIESFADVQAASDVGTEAGEIEGQMFDEAGGTLSTVSSAGGSNLAADRTAIRSGIRDTLNAQITQTGASATPAAAKTRAVRWAAEHASRMSPETQTQLAQAVDSATTAAQVATAMRRARNEVVNSLTDEEVGAAPARQQVTPEIQAEREAERQAQQAESAALAAQRQAEVQGALTDAASRAEARQGLATSQAREAGGKWNKRAGAWWAEMVPDQPMVTWDTLVDQYTAEALSWAVSVYEIDMNMEMDPDEKRVALRTLFEDFANAFANGTAQQNPDGQGLLSADRPAEPAAVEGDGPVDGQPGADTADAGAGPAVEPEPAVEETVELSEAEPGSELQDIRETVEARTDRYDDDPAAAFIELGDAMADLDATIALAEEAGAKEDVKKLERIRRDVNKAMTDAQRGEGAPSAAAQAVHDTYEVIAPLTDGDGNPSEPARNYSLAKTATDAINDQTNSATRLERADALRDLLIEVRQREQAGDPMSVHELAQASRALAGDDTNISAWLDELSIQLRTFTVRVTADPIFRPEPETQALGFHAVDSMTVWLNSDRFQAQALQAIMEVYPNSNNDPARDFAEMVAHELLHVVTVDAVMQADPNSATRVELRAIKEDIRTYMQALEAEIEVIGDSTGYEDYLLFRLRLMTDDRQHSETLTHGELELITYALTDETVRRAMANMHSQPGRPGTYQNNMLKRFVDWVWGVLSNRDRVPRVQSMLSRIENITQDLMEQDTRNAVRELSLEDSFTSELWDYAREQARMLDIPYGSQSLQDTVERFRPQVEDAMARAEDAWIEVMEARMEGAILGDEINSDMAAKLATVQRALFDVNLYAGEMQQRIMSNPDLLLESRSDRGVSDAGFRNFAMAYEGNKSYVPTKRDQASSWARRMYAALPDKISDAAVDMHDRIRGLGMLTMFTSQFVDYVDRWLPTVRSYYDTIRWRVSERNAIHTKIQETVGEVAGWNHQRRTQLNKFLAEATYRGKWGFQPDWIPNATVDPAMEERFNRMDADQQRVAKNMFREAHSMHQALQRELRGDIERVFDESIANATQPGRIQRLQNEKADALAAHDNRQKDFRDAYLPLKRWGKWAVVYKSQAFKDAEQRGNRREIDQMKQDESHYMVSFADTQYAARQLRREWEESMGTTIDDPFPRMRYDEKNELVPFDLLQRLKQASSKGAGVESGVSTKLDEALNRLYIEALSESSVRKSELRRIGVRGFDEDMVRAFVQHGQGVASLTSAIRINWQTREHIANMKDEAQRPKTGTRRDSMAALNEILARHAASLEPEEPGIQQRMMGMTSVWMLLTSPAYYIQNATQPFMLTLPVMAARYGFGKASAHMTKAYKDIGDTWWTTRQDPTRQGDLMDPDKIEDPNERDLIVTLQGLNQLDVGIAADLGSLSDARTGTMRLLNRAHRKMVTGVRTVEVFNRGVTALASYRLAYEANIRKGMPESRARSSAKEYAIRAVDQTQGDYSGQNAPRLISKIPAGRLVTQFRKFQLIQIGLLVRTVHQAFKGSTAEEKAVGRRQLQYILGAHAAVGGLTGLPAANIISMVVGMAFGMGDDDEPAGVEMRVRRAIGDKAIADLILQGFPAWAGIDASNRLGMGMTFSILPFTDVDLSRDGFATLAGTLALGPTGAVGGSMLQGMGKMMSGDMLGGTADMMPAGLKNAMKAYSYATEGIQTRTGITAITAEELNWFDLAAQAAGWPSKAISDRWEMYGMLIETEEFFRERTGRIKRAFTEAYEEGDARGMDEARDEWRRLQRSRRDYNVGQPQGLSELLKAPRDKRQKEAAMIGGVPTERTTRRFVQELFE